MQILSVYGSEHNNPLNAGLDKYCPDPGGSRKHYFAILRGVIYQSYDMSFLHPLTV